MERRRHQPQCELCHTAISLTLFSSTKPNLGALGEATSNNHGDILYSQHEPSKRNLPYSTALHRLPKLQEIHRNCCRLAGQQWIWKPHREEAEIQEANNNQYNQRDITCCGGNLQAGTHSVSVCAGRLQGYTPEQGELLPSPQLPQQYFWWSWTLPSSNIYWRWDMDLWYY